MVGRLMKRVVFFALVAAAILALFPRSALAKTASIGDPLRIEVPGASDAYYYKPRAKGQQPILMYLHGRGGNPAEDCRKWARVGTQFGWVVCPSGTATAEGGRSWSDGNAEHIVAATVKALREKYHSKVQLRGNVLMGFSEGAWAAMNVGLHDQATWNRWLIMGAASQYWGDVSEALDKDKRKVRKVYLLTGENDGVAKSTLAVGDTLKKFKVPNKVKLVPGLGHEVPQDRMVSTYRRPLAWLLTEPKKKTEKKTDKTETAEKADPAEPPKK
jgi:predicted esterase